MIKITKVIKIILKCSILYTNVSNGQVINGNEYQVVGKYSFVSNIGGSLVLKPQRFAD